MLRELFPKAFWAISESNIKYSRQQARKHAARIGSCSTNKMNQTINPKRKKKRRKLWCNTRHKNWSLTKKLQFFLPILVALAKRVHNMRNAHQQPTSSQMQAKARTQRIGLLGVIGTQQGSPKNLYVPERQEKGACILRLWTWVVSCLVFACGVHDYEHETGDMTGFHFQKNQLISPRFQGRPGQPQPSNGSRMGALMNSAKLVRKSVFQCLWG